MTHTIERKNGTNESAPFVNTPHRALTLNASPDILVAGTGTVTHDGVKASYGVADGTVAAGVIVTHPRPLSWLGGRLTYRCVGVQVGEVTGRQVSIGFSNGTQFAVFVIADGALSVSYGEIGGTSNTVSRTAGFSAALPIFDPKTLHEYEVSVGLDGRIAWCIDGVEVYAVSTATARLALHPAMHTGVALINTSSTSGAASFDVFDEEWTSEDAPKGNEQSILISHSDSAGVHVSCVALESSLPHSRLARLLRVRSTTPSAIASLDIFTSRAAPDDTPVAVEAGHPLALISNTAPLNAQVFADGDRIVDSKFGVFPDVVNELVFARPPEIALPVYGGTPGSTIATPQPVYLYLVATTTAAAGNMHTELTFEIE